MQISFGKEHYQEYLQRIAIPHYPLIGRNSSCIICMDSALNIKHLQHFHCFIHGIKKKKWTKDYRHHLQSPNTIRRREQGNGSKSSRSPFNHGCGTHLPRSWGSSSVKHLRFAPHLPSSPPAPPQTSFGPCSEGETGSFGYLWWCSFTYIDFFFFIHTVWVLSEQTMSWLNTRTSLTWHTGICCTDPHMFRGRSPCCPGRSVRIPGRSSCRIP